MNSVIEAQEEYFNHKWPTPLIFNNGGTAAILWDSKLRCELLADVVIYKDVVIYSVKIKPPP